MSLTIMLLIIRPLFYSLALTIRLVPLSAATKLHQSSVEPSPTRLQRKLTPELNGKPSCARLFTSTAASSLMDLSQNPFRDNMTASIELQLTPALLQDVREFWFKHLDNVDSFIVAGQGATKRWYGGGDEFDQQCVYVSPTPLIS